MADANCEVTYSRGDDCCNIDLASPIVTPPQPSIPPEPEIIVGPPGPPGPPGEDGLPGPENTRFAFVFVFGDALNLITAGVKITEPSPYAGTAKRWRARVAGDITSSVVFDIKKATSVLDPLVSVGGTQPDIVADKGNQALSLDWTDITIAIGEVLEAEYVSGDASGVTLVVEYETI